MIKKSRAGSMPAFFFLFRFFVEKEKHEYAGKDE